VGKEDAACYRLYAANCVELAERISDAPRRVFLLRMAQCWARLADQIEKAEKTSRAEITGQMTGSGAAPQLPPVTDAANGPAARSANADEIRADTGGHQTRGSQTDGDAGVGSGG
jgi:hypothetical protein